MWNKSLFLLVRVRVTENGRGLRFALPIAVYTLNWLLLSCGPLLELLPGAWGQKARDAVDTVHAILYEIEDSKPQSFVHVSTEEDEKKVLVDIKTCGVLTGEGEEL